MPERPPSDVDESIEVLDDGSIVTTPASRSVLADRRGRWRLVPQGGDLLVFARGEATAAAERGIQILGSIDGAETLMGVLHFLAMGQESGALYVESRDVVRVLYLHRGKLLSARSNRVQDRLGEILVGDRVVTREQVEACFCEGSEGDLLGRSLLHKGLLNNHQIYEGLRRQSQEIFAGVMMVERGIYYLVKPLDMSEVPAMLHLDVQELLFEGLRRSDELKHLRSVVPSDEMVLQPAEHERSAELSDDAARLLLRLDGRATLAVLFEALRLDGLEGVKAAAELIETGAAAEIKPEPADASIRPEEPASQLARSIVATYESALQVVLDAISSEPGPARRNLVAMFLRSTENFASLVQGLAVGEDGSLDAETLVTRAAADGGEGVDLLRRCLHELLFFLLFEVGQRGDQELFAGLHRRVADILARQPTSSAA